MPSRSWIQASIHLPLHLQDLLTGQLAEIGFTGFQQEDRALHCFIEQKRWNPKRRARLSDLLARFKKEFPSVDVVPSTRTIRNQNWNARWERSIGIVEATNRIIIRPSWRPLRKRDKGKIAITIDPKMSFGTGHHETTRLCLTLLEEFVMRGARVLDIGSGTGVLSIAAVKLGAARAIGIDHDPWAVLNARENVRRNRVVRSVQIRKNSTGRLPAGRFAVIASNIDLPTNLRLLPSILARMAPDGVIILSGFLASDLRTLLDHLKNKGILPLELLEENEWIAVALMKPDAIKRS